MTRAFYPIKKSGQQGELVIMFREADQFMSNFYPCDVVLPAEVINLGPNVITLPAMAFGSTEQAYMAWKTIDLNIRQNMQTMSPGDCKALTHQPNFPIRPDYSDDKRVAIMYALNRQKYSDRNPQLKSLLMQTGEMTLIEGNTWGDRFFGFDLVTGQGQNFLGRILMQIRQELRQENDFPTQVRDYGLGLS